MKKGIIFVSFLLVSNTNAAVGAQQYTVTKCNIIKAELAHIRTQQKHNNSESLNKRERKVADTRDRHCKRPIKIESDGKLTGYTVKKTRKKTSDKKFSELGSKPWTLSGSGKGKKPIAEICFGKGCLDKPKKASKKLSKKEMAWLNFYNTPVGCNKSRFFESASCKEDKQKQRKTFESFWKVHSSN